MWTRLSRSGTLARKPVIVDYKLRLLGMVEASQPTLRAEPVVHNADTSSSTAKVCLIHGQMDWIVHALIPLKVLLSLLAFFFPILYTFHFITITLQETLINTSHHYHHYVFEYLPQLLSTPLELHSQIWTESMPTTTTTIHIREGADLEVTAVSPPPGRHLTNKEAREAYLSKNFTSHQIFTVEDDAEIHINEDTTIQLIITPSANLKANLNVTWTELEVLLYEALPVVKKLQIVCRKPERLVRLFMLPEADLVAVGQSHWLEESLIQGSTEGGAASDRRYRETFNESLEVSTSAATLDEIAQGRTEEVQTWQLGDEDISEGFGPEARMSTTKAFKLVGRENDEPEVELPPEMEGEEEESLKVKGEEEVRGEGATLTEEGIAKLLEETKWKPKPSTTSSIYSGGGSELYYDGELWLTKG